MSGHPRSFVIISMMSLDDRRTNQLKTLTFKTVNRQVPEYISDKWSWQHNLFVPRPYTEVFKESFWYRDAVLWNSLSVEA